MHEYIKAKYNSRVEPLVLCIQAILSVGCVERASSDSDGHNDQ